jgi:hypothetical protein
MQQTRDAGKARRAALAMPGARPPGWLAQAPFAAEAARIVDALCRMRLRVSVYVLRFEGLTPSRAHALAEDALRQEGLVGRLPEGSIGLLRIADDAPPPEALRARLARRLAAQLWRSGPVEAPVTLHVAERHGWTDRFDGAAEAIEDLMDEPGAALALERPWRG